MEFLGLEYVILLINTSNAKWGLLRNFNQFIHQICNYFLALIPNCRNSRKQQIPSSEHIKVKIRYVNYAIRWIWVESSYGQKSSSPISANPSICKIRKFNGNFSILKLRHCAEKFWQISTSAVSALQNKTFLAINGLARGRRGGASKRGIRQGFRRHPSEIVLSRVP